MIEILSFEPETKILYKNCKISNFNPLKNTQKINQVRKTFHQQGEKNKLKLKVENKINAGHKQKRQLIPFSSSECENKKS